MSDGAWGLFCAPGTKSLVSTKEGESTSGEFQKASWWRCPLKIPRETNKEGISGRGTTEGKQKAL